MSDGGVPIGMLTLTSMLTQQLRTTYFTSVRNQTRLGTSDVRCLFSCVITVWAAIPEIISLAISPGSRIWLRGGGGGGLTGGAAH